MVLCWGQEVTGTEIEQNGVKTMQNGRATTAPRCHLASTAALKREQKNGALGHRGARPRRTSAAAPKARTRKKKFTAPRRHFDKSSLQSEFGQKTCEKPKIDQKLH